MASDFKLSYDICQYKVEVTHAAGCPVNNNSNDTSEETEEQTEEETQEEAVVDT